MSVARCLSCLTLAALPLGMGCGETEGIPGTQVRYAPAGTVWDAPFPGEHLRGPGGIRLRGLPNPLGIELVTDLRRLIERDADGFGVSSPVYFPFDRPLDPGALPDILDTVAPSSPVQLVDVDPGSPERGRRIPLDLAILDDGGPFGAPNLLAALPVQGVPLREGTLYAAFVLRRLGDIDGDPLGAPKALRQLLLDGEPGDLGADAFSELQVAARALEAQGVDLEALAAFTAFRTGTPTAELRRFVDAIRAEPPPRLTRPFRLTDAFDTFCVFEAETEVPVYQRGDPPYATSGGGWNLDGDPMVERWAPSRLVLTIPRRAQDRLPLAVFVRTGGGGDRPLVDRGVRAEPGGEAVAPGTGPAMELAEVGFAGLSWDGPHGGLRGDGSDEQFAVFNFVNPEALRDNIRQTAIEAPWLLGLVPSLTITATTCGLEDVRVDPERVALMGHSMGATIAPLAAAFEPRFGAVVLSGAGGSWIENVIHKERPLMVRPFAEILLDYDDLGRTLTAHDPALALLQWAGEPADPPLFAGRLRGVDAPGRHVLMFQGFDDRYIPPPVANALSWALRLDLAGPVLDEGRFAQLAPLLGAAQVELPVEHNRGERTQALTQHLEGPVEGGHEVMFQTEGPKRMYRCFLADYAAGRAPTVPDPAGCD